MPPIRKTDLDKPRAHPKPYLSKSHVGSNLKTLIDESTKVNLSSSCFGAIRTEKGDPDDDLTSLNWLQNNDILKGFEVSPTVPPVSPTRDFNGGIFETPPREGEGRGSSVDSSANRRKSPSKPPYSFSSLIFMAIEEAPMKRLPVKDIYSWIMEHFPYFRDARLGWKNSVRHNLSLNKCFKKVDKEKSQNLGKGSLWTVDPDHRPTLLQALKKMPSFHPYHHLFTTPPPSPKSGGADSSPGNNAGKIEVDPDAEAEAVATICMISTHPAVRVAEMVRCQSCPPSETDREELLVKKAKEFYYRHRGSFSGAVSMAKDRNTSLLLDSHKRKRTSLSSSLSKIDAARMKQNISPDSSLDGEFEFDRQVDSDEDDDSELEETMEKVIKDELSDSGYGQGIEDEIERKKAGRNTKPMARQKRGRQDSTTEKLNAIAGADALLELANSAFNPSPQVSSASSSPIPQCSAAMVS